MLSLTRRIAATVLIFFLSSAGFGLCAGWEATAEARMACCMSGDRCPMHKSSATAAGATHVVSQADADDCCAGAERDNSTPSSSAFVPVISLAPVVSPISALFVPTATPFDAWRAHVPLPGSQVPKHLLLSVFLI